MSGTQFATTIARLSLRAQSLVDGDAPIIVADRSLILTLIGELNMMSPDYRSLQGQRATMDMTWIVVAGAIVVDRAAVARYGFNTIIARARTGARTRAPGVEDDA